MKVGVVLAGVVLVPVGGESFILTDLLARTDHGGWRRPGMSLSGTFE